MKKTIIAIIAVIALVAILGTVLVACNAENYEKRLKDKGYKVERWESSDSDSKIVWSVSALKVSGNLTALDFDGESVEIIKYRKADDAKKAYDDYKAELKEMGDDADDYAVKKIGNIVIVGTKQGVKDAG